MTEVKNESVEKVEEVKVPAKKSKAVTISFFNKKAKDINTVEKFYLDNERTQHIDYYPLFSKPKRDAIIKELLETVQYTVENDLDHLATQEQVYQHLDFLIVKQFVPMVSKQLEGKDYNTHLEVKSVLNVTDYITIFMHEMFDIDEIAKVYNQYHVALDRIQKAEKMINKAISDKKELDAKQGLKSVAVKSQK